MGRIFNWLVLTPVNSEGALMFVLLTSLLCHCLINLVKAVNIMLNRNVFNSWFVDMSSVIRTQNLYSVGSEA